MRRSRQAVLAAGAAPIAGYLPLIAGCLRSERGGEDERADARVDTAAEIGLKCRTSEAMAHTKAPARVIERSNREEFRWIAVQFKALAGEFS